MASPRDVLFRMFSVMVALVAGSKDRTIAANVWRCTSILPWSNVDIGCFAPWFMGLPFRFGGWGESRHFTGQGRPATCVRFRTVRCHARSVRGLARHIHHNHHEVS